MSELSVVARCAVSYAVSLTKISVVGECTVEELCSVRRVLRHRRDSPQSGVHSHSDRVFVPGVTYSALKPFFSTFGIPVRWGTGARGNGGAGLYIAGRYSFLN